MTAPTVSPSEAIIISRQIFEKRRYPATDEDIRNLSKNIILLQSRGLFKLNERLIEGGRKIWDTFVEHNFAVSLVSQLDPTVSISYEPSEGLQRPPDFKIIKNGITYWIQIKNLASLERENRQANIIKEIQRQISIIDIVKFLGCRLAETFSTNDIAGLVSFITQISKEASEGREYVYPDEASSKAIIEFWSPNKAALSHLTIGISGDIDIVEQTGLAKEQIRQSILNAAGAFDWPADAKTINLVAMDSNNYEDIDICDALFGTEFELFKAGRQAWSREQDGLFGKHPFNERLVGVLALKRINKWTPVSTYRMSLFLNEAFKNCNDVTGLYSFEQVIRYNMRPPMGFGNFKNENNKNDGEQIAQPDRE
jgi:hypothetical protein